MKYSAELTNNLKNLFEVQKLSVPQIADQLGTTPRSVIAKLSSMGLYRKKPYLSKTGQPPLPKETILDEVALELQVTVDQLESLEKTNKRVLLLILAKLRENNSLNQE